MMVILSTINGSLMHVNGRYPRVFFLVNADFFVPVYSVVTSKTIINVHWEGCDCGRDGREP